MSSGSEAAATGSDAVFTDDVVAAISRHMNVDHPEDTLVICRAHGGVPEATAACMTGLDADGGDYVATVHGTDVVVRIPWAHTLTERPQVRAEVVRLYDEACVTLGLPSREAQQH